MRFIVGMASLFCSISVWLATSLSMRGHEQAPVAALLQQAERYDPSEKIIEMIRSLPELQDFPYEPQFQPLSA